MFIAFWSLWSGTGQEEKEMIIESRELKEGAGGGVVVVDVWWEGGLVPGALGCWINLDGVWQMRG